MYNKKTILQLLPDQKTHLDLHGLYLKHNIQQLGQPGKPFVYANFLSSIDGRIAVIDKTTALPTTPRSLTSREDFRLFQELEAQSDCLITHGGYLRSLANGHLGNILQIGLRDDARDLLRWRKKNGLSQQPDLVIASASLDFTIPESLARHQQNVLIATTEQSRPDRIEYWKNSGYEVVIAGKNLVDGDKLINILAKRLYQSIYLIAGPLMLETMIRHCVLNRLYLTMNHQLLGGDQFHSLIPGACLKPGISGHLKILEHYFDPQSSNGQSQFFSSYSLHTANR
ncbi:MAG: dihydrofolate reductase family protein [Gammaproteobacteria bacterium]|nr:dihydrofolate reductase family protein [Gammaproteobacteria bacterium]